MCSYQIIMTLVVKRFEQQKGVGSSKRIIGLLSCLILEMEIASINHNFLSIEGNNHMSTKYIYIPCIINSVLC